MVVVEAWESDELDEDDTGEDERTGETGECSMAYVIDTTSSTIPFAALVQWSSTTANLNRILDSITLGLKGFCFGFKSIIDDG